MVKKIGVVGAGLVGSCFKGLDNFQVVHRNEWKDKIQSWAGVVNCAGIIGLKQCERVSFDDVLRANVVLPLEMAESALMLNIPFVQFSTAAVYRRENLTDSVTEDMPLYPYHTYGASKILMESLLPSKTFIFRIPMVSTFSGAENDFEEKIKRWIQVEDANISMVYRQTLIEAVSNALKGDIPQGIYNVASKSVYLPSYVRERCGRAVEMVSADKLNRPPAITLEVSKAKAYKLL